MPERTPLTPTQRGILGVLGSAVAITGLGLAVLVALPGDSPDPISETTDAAPSTAPPVVEAPTTTLAETTTTTMDTTTTTLEETTTTTMPLETFVVRPDGIDLVFFGNDAEETIDTFIDRLDEPDDDTGWVDQFTEYDGLCVGTLVRFVTWGELELFFTDGPSLWADAGVEHFASYHIGADDDLAIYETSAGIGIGSTIADARRAYGDQASTSNDPIYGPIFEWDPPGDGYLFGTLTGLDNDDVITSITGGFSCGE